MNDHEDGAPGEPGRVFRGRRRTRAEERIDALDVSPTALTAEVERLKEQLATLEQEAAESKAGWQRSMADLANFRRRTDQEREATLGLASEFLLLKLLTIVDDFDRALAQMPPELAKLGWAEGLWAIDRKLRQLIESEGLTPIEAEGMPFDPREHQAVAQEATDAVPDGTVLAELQRGYRIRDRVLRPAMVTVATNDKHDQDDQTRESGHQAAGGQD